MLLLSQDCQIWHDGRLMHGIYIMLMLISTTLTLIKAHSGLAEGKKSALNYLDKSRQILFHLTLTFKKIMA